MNTRRYWRFPIPNATQDAEGLRKQVSFLEMATEEGHKAYSDEGGVLGAVASNGRVGELIPRGGVQDGLRRYWEVLFSQGSHTDDSFYVDGFENAAECLLLWLRGEESSHVRSCIRAYIVDKPGQRGW